MPLNPTEYYPGQQSKEEIVLFLRKHWWAYMKWGWIIALVSVVPWIFFAIMVANGVWYDIYNLSPTMPYFLIIFISVYYLFTLALFVTTWIDYYLDVVIITKSTLVKIKQEGLFIRGVAEQNLLRVQDVTSETKGPIQNMLKFGTVCVETAGEQPNFNLSFIENPNFVADTIMRLHRELVENFSEEEIILETKKKNKEPLQEEKVIEIQIPKQAIKTQKTEIIKPRVQTIPTKPLIVDYKPDFLEEEKLPQKSKNNNLKDVITKEQKPIDKRTPNNVNDVKIVSRNAQEKSTGNNESHSQELEEGKVIKF